MSETGWKSRTFMALERAAESLGPAVGAPEQLLTRGAAAVAEFTKNQVNETVGRLGVAAVRSRYVPKQAVWLAARHYIAGEQLDDALEIAQSRMAEAENIGATIDVLGEAIQTPDAAEMMFWQYINVLTRINQYGPRVNTSVKPTALGLNVSPKLLHTNLDRLMARAADQGTFVRLEAEQAELADATQEAFMLMHREGYGKFIGLVLQASLHRTSDDIKRITGEVGPFDARLVKGIYQEAPDVGRHLKQDYEAIRLYYLAHMMELVCSGSQVAIATHDDWIIRRIMNGTDYGGFPHHKIKEFQMLLGVQEELADKVIAWGKKPFRLYVPFGEQWRPYVSRRLQENPDLVGTIASDIGQRIMRGTRELIRL